MHINTHNNYHKKIYIETPKIYNHCTHIQIIIIKTLLLFFFIRMSGKKINFGNKDIKKSDFYNKNKENI